MISLEGNADLARALMFAAADMIDREVLKDPDLPLHYSFTDRAKDAWACLRGRAFVLRKVGLDYQWWGYLRRQDRGE